jgi:hypothetical protein
MSRQDERFDLKVDDIKHETARAVLVVIEGKEHWLPFSQIHAIHRNQKLLSVTPWIAKKIGAY